MSAVQEYNITLHEESPTFLYAPFRDGDVMLGWNSSYSNNKSYTPVPAGTPGQDVGGGGIGSGMAFRRTLYNGSTVTLTFQGTAVYLCLATEGASYTLSVDNQAATKALPASAGACSDYEAQTLAVADGLTYGAHTAVLTAFITNPNSSFSFYGGVVTISAGVAGSNISDPIYIDDTDSGWTWTPGHANWGFVNWDTSAYNNTLTYNGNWNEATYATYTIEAGISALWVLSPARFNSYSYTVSLDGNEATHNATNFWTSDQQVAFFAGGLDPSVSHIITLKNFDASSPSVPAHGPALYIDALVLVPSTPPPTSISLASTASTTAPLSSGIAASTTAQPSFSMTVSTTAQPSFGMAAPGKASQAPVIAGATVGAVAALLLLALATCFVLRRQRQRAALKMTPNPFQDGALPTPYSASDTAAAYGAPMKQREIRHPTSHAPSGVPALHPSASGIPPTSEHTITPLRRIATVDLVQVLNERLRVDQLDNVEAPPLYD